MTNLQEAADRSTLLVQQRLLLGVPIGIGALLAALIAGFGVLPQWLSLQANSERTAQLEALQARIPLLRAQIAKVAEAQETAERKQQQVLQLIEGSGELSTFLAQLDREALRTGVQLDLYEPVAGPPVASATVAKKAPQQETQPPPPASPLEAAGLQAQKVLLSAKGAYPSLLAFLRAMEQLNVLLTQSNLALTVVTPPPAGGASSAPALAAKTELKLMLTYYRSAEAAVPKPAASKN